ncbi:MAG TPA: hypothetical protein VI815_01930 [Candidatus Nanoarchaeia archaeon]|nr:hypothetical protein [Candidatus Nanoarchaeia archaeon]
MSLITLNNAYYLSRVFEDIGKAASSRLERMIKESKEDRIKKFREKPWIYGSGRFYSK